MSDWTFVDVWELAASNLPSAPAQICGDRQISWSDFDRRADGLAAALVDAVGVRQSKVAQYLFNCPEYLESVLATFKAGMVPVNTNYRYREAELIYLWDNADVEAVIFHSAFSELVDSVRTHLPNVKIWICVADDAGSDRPPFADDYEHLATSSALRSKVRRSGDDLYLLYTGGTTGMPKGVMWRVDDLFCLSNRMAKVQFDLDGTLDEASALLAVPGPKFLPACPLMHGTAAIQAFSALSSGGCIVTLQGRQFDEMELLDTIDRVRAKSLAIVGDAFARPMVDCLDAEPTRWDLSSLRLILSSGAMWSAPIKAALLRHLPRARLIDSLGSSEAMGMAYSVTSQASSVDTARFRLSDDTAVIDEDGDFIAPGSEGVGLLAVRGRNPLGYYKDPDKSAATFRVMHGERWSVPGDLARVERDGTLTLLGRGSNCINTGGEKVFPEEVEEALKEHQAVRDAAVVGLPHPRFGEAVAALVEVRADATIDLTALQDHVRARLAAYKVPRSMWLLDSVERAANGKLDYARLRSIALSHSTLDAGASAADQTA